MATKITTHVILPSGIRYEHHWSDTDAYGNTRPLPSDEKILQGLAAGKQLFGYNGTVKKTDPSTGLPVMIDHGDPASGFAYDHPNTVVAIIEKDTPITDVVREIRRLKGPALLPLVNPVATTISAQETPSTTPSTSAEEYGVEVAPR